MTIRYAIVCVIAGASGGLIITALLFAVNTWTDPWIAFLGSVIGGGITAAAGVAAYVSVKQQIASDKATTTLALLMEQYMRVDRQCEAMSLAYSLVNEVRTIANLNVGTTLSGPSINPLEHELDWLAGLNNDVMATQCMTEPPIATRRWVWWVTRRAAAFARSCRQLLGNAVGSARVAAETDALSRHERLVSCIDAALKRIERDRSDHRAAREAIGESIRSLGGVPPWRHQGNLERVRFFARQ